MAYLDVYYGRIGSYNGSIKIDESTINNTTQFSSTGSGQYTSHNFIKPVGLFQHMGNNEYNVFVFAISTNYSADCIQWYQNYSGHSISYGRIVGGFTLTTIQSQYIPNINYFNVIPWFNNIDDASNWSCGNSFNPANWVGGLDVRVQYNWQSVPSISGKNGILSLATLKEESINDGEPVSGAAASVFDQAPSNDNNIKNLADTYGGGEESSAVDVTVKYKVTLPPGGVFNVLKLVAKKDSIPEDASDGDKIVDISPSKTKKTVTGLNENSLYYFKIFGEDTNNKTSESNEKHIHTTSEIVVPFREEVVVEKKTGDDEYTIVYTWTGKWGKQDDAITEGFEVLTSENAELTESQMIEGFEESYAENNWISEAQDAEIQT